jgi:hypothetical protein
MASLAVRRFAALIAVLALTAVLLPAAQAGSRQTVLPTLYVDYSMNCTFVITDDDGRRVTSIAPGTYQILVRTVVVFALVDLSGIEDFTACKSFVQFQITGPGVNIFTTLQEGDEDKEMFKETFQANSTYTAVELLRPTVARVAFSTTSSSTTPNAPATPYVPSANAGKPTQSTDIVGSARKPTTLRGTLNASVSAAGKLSLTLNGKPVGSLKEGRYTTTITDASKKAGFIFLFLNKNGLAISSVNATGVKYTGKRTIPISLKKGQWSFVATSGSKKTFFIVVGT